MPIKTLEKDTIDTDDVLTYKCCSIAQHYPHWGWWVLWALIFYPALLAVFLMGIMRKKYHVECHYGRYSDTHWLDENSYKLFQQEMVDKWDHERCVHDKKSSKKQEGNTDD